MTFGAKRRTTYIEYDHRPLPPNALAQRVLGGTAVRLGGIEVRPIIEIDRNNIKRTWTEYSTKSASNPREPR